MSKRSSDKTPAQTSSQKKKSSDIKEKNDAGHSNSKSKGKTIEGTCVNVARDLNKTIQLEDEKERLEDENNELDQYFNEDEVKTAQHLSTLPLTPGSAEVVKVLHYIARIRRRERVKRNASLGEDEVEDERTIEKATKESNSTRKWKGVLNTKFRGTLPPALDE
jgi:hypothetical protein